MKLIIHGKVENGQIVLPDDVELPEGATVSIQVRNGPQLPPKGPDEPSDEPKSLLERMGPLVGAAENLPPDASINIDHYLYGLPKRKSP